MKSTTVAALTALLSAGALAVPMAGHHKAPAHGHMHMRNKRDIVWVTKTEVETVVVMKTVYDDGTSPSEPTDAATTTIKATAPVTTSSVVPPPSSPSETGGSPPPAYTPPSSSAAPAPTSTTSAYVPPPPPPSSTQAPAPTTYAPEPAPTTYSPEPAPQPSYSPPAPAPSPSQPSGGSGGGATFTGDATYWVPGLGACGWTNTDSEDVVAVAKSVYDATPVGNPNNSPVCGKMVAIKCKDGSTVQAKVVDRCVGCASGDLDMTKTLFDKVTSFGDGRVGGMQWSWA